MKKVLLFTGVFFMICILTGCGKAGDYDRDGRKSFAEGNYEKAAEAFSAAVAANPNRADYFIDYGMSLTALGKYEEALTQFDKAYLDKNLLIVRENNKRVLRGKGIAYYSQQQYDKAAAEFQKALEIGELSELDLDILYYMADCLMKSGFYDKAVKEFTSILSVHGEDAAAHAKRAICYKNLGDRDKSLADYDSAISLQPENYNYYFGKYDLLTGYGDTAGASEVLKKAGQIKAETDEDNYHAAVLHFLQGEYDTTLIEFQDSYSKGFQDAGFYMGEIYRIRKDYEKAVYNYEDYIKKAGVVSPEVYNQIGACLIKTGNYEAALEYLDKGITYNNDSTDQAFLKNEIVAYENLGRYEDANQKLVTYLEAFPDDTDAAREAEFLNTRLITESNEE
jgi:tetratricopeptide (TPR) repeat protein